MVLIWVIIKIFCQLLSREVLVFFFRTKLKTLFQLEIFWPTPYFFQPGIVLLRWAIFLYSDGIHLSWIVIFIIPVIFTRLKINYKRKWWGDKRDVKAFFVFNHQASFWALSPLVLMHSLSKRVCIKTLILSDKYIKHKWPTLNLNRFKCSFKF